MGNSLLEIRDLRVVYETEEATVFAVNGVDLELNPGETLGIVGETGAGKTTTALSIMGLLPPEIGFVRGGTIKLDGVDITTASEEQMTSIRGRVASMVFQDPMTSLNPIMTVGAQIAEVYELHRQGMSREERERRVCEMLEMVGIPADRRVEYPHQFSGGMKQRVGIALALACEPKLLIADEPTTALDVTIQAQMLRLMQELKTRLQTAVLLITHDFGVVAETCDRVAVMYAGEIVEEGPIEAIFESKRRHPYTEGLFGSIPDLTTVTRRLTPIEGAMPDPTNPPTGCGFYDRCPRRAERCALEKPQPRRSNGHSVRCRFV